MATDEKAAIGRASRRWRMAMAMSAVLVAGLVLLSAWGLWTLRRPDAARHAARAVLAQPIPAPSARDAAPLFWVIGHDVPAPARAAAAARVVAQLQAQREARRSATRRPVQLLTFDYPALAAAPAHPALCTADGEDCLTRVAGQRTDTERLLRAHAPALAMAAAVSGHGSYRYPLAQDVAMRLPDFLAHRGLLLSQHALRFVQGEATAAAAGLCADLRAWRGILVDSDLQAASMAASRAVDEDLRLLGDFLADWPTGQAWPGECGQALSEPRDAEYSICLPLRGDFRMVANSLDGHLMARPEVWRGRPWAAASFDVDRLLSRMAPDYARHCRPEVVAELALDQPWSALARPVRRCPVWERWLDPGVCQLLVRLKPDKSRFQDRRTDTLAKIKLFRALLWLRGQPGFPSSARDLLPLYPELGRGLRPVFVSEDGQWLELPLYERRMSAPWRLRLASRIETAPVSSRAAAAVEIPAATGQGTGSAQGSRR